MPQVEPVPRTFWDANLRRPRAGDAGGAGDSPAGRYTQPRIFEPAIAAAAGCARLCDGQEGLAPLFASLRFVWNATRRHRLRPWRSEYLKWRIETYSGMKAEELRARDIFAFVWREKGKLLHFLRWTDRMETWRKAGAGHRPGQGSDEWR